MDILLTEDQIQQKVSEMAAAISQAYAGRELHLVGLLNNAFMFVADLVRRLTCPMQCSFVHLEMRDVIENGHERRLISYSPSLELQGQDVLVVDCILHTGVTQEHLIEQFRAKGAASVCSAVLIDKSDERRVPLVPEFAGFRLQEPFLVGYGMGEAGRYRNLPFVARLAPNAASATS